MKRYGLAFVFSWFVHVISIISAPLILIPVTFQTLNAYHGGEQQPLLQNPASRCDRRQACCIGLVFTGGAALVTGIIFAMKYYAHEGPPILQPFDPSTVQSHNPAMINFGRELPQGIPEIHKTPLSIKSFSMQQHNKAAQAKKRQKMRYLRGN